ncbi:ABC transporter substrate-binding protein [Pseudomonas typographi]|uniref:Spermidine/putrescine ABC transporter substrate-binding protein n=1 Tax=Pseudomonas typographi TaxID=2715964 RepID=A0ABR7YYE4_9PSED|nr:spermidine/putrescine ABC transporter substrate-binding protein [Pseudomonas typographi]MBD1550769.1 spermidine/putrescine ABC transporter substrate-binding protein [Pseudomonas typographi]MBD1598234.1 spermidine/putrescine ABC transporter substrate-binding protein [Pseudomonas typographi]
MDANTFLKLMRSWQNGSMSRRDFLGRSGLGVAAAILAANLPRAQAAPGQLRLETWPNYHSAANLEHFQQSHGVKVVLDVSGSNEEMLGKARDAAGQVDLLVATNYVIASYAAQRLIEPLDLARLPNFDPGSYDARMLAQGKVGSTVYGVPKNWGTTGMVYNARRLAAKPESWKDFWALAKTEGHRRTLVHDYPLTTIGNALKACGFSFNSLAPAELAQAEAVLMDAKPHLLAITSDIQPLLQSGQAWLAMAWTGDATLLHRGDPAMTYVLGSEGGEIWTDFYCIARGSPNKNAAYALIDYVLTPATNKREVLEVGYPCGDRRVDPLLPTELLNDPIMYPAAEALSPLEYGAAATLTSPRRAEIMARLKA